MTESEWNDATDPQGMLSFLHATGTLSERKLRLFACACVRRIWYRLGEAEVREEIDVSERFAEGISDIKELNIIRSKLGARGGYSAAWAANNALHAVLEVQAENAAELAAIYTADFVYWFTEEQKPLTRSEAQNEALAAREYEQEVLAALLRDVVAPFRPSYNAASAWNDGTIKALAEAAYEHRSLPSGHLDSLRLGVLADALEEAGADAPLLEHLRGPGPHTRGCFGIDLILGKN